MENKHEMNIQQETRSHQPNKADDSDKDHPDDSNPIWQESHLTHAKHNTEPESRRKKECTQKSDEDYHADYQTGDEPANGSSTEMTVQMNFGNPISCTI